MNVLFFALSPVFAAELPPEARAAEARPAPNPGDDGFTFLGLMSTRAVATSVRTNNALLNGQIVGQLGGTNDTTTGSPAAFGTEHRVGAFFRYAPPVLDGRAALDAAFEIDFGFGDASYSVGGNAGGAYGADQVNLQTRRLSGRYRIGDATTAVVGLQFVADGVNDPATSKLDDLVRSGGRLIFFGSEAAGATVYGAVPTPMWDALRWKAGAYTLYEMGVGDPDDITLWMGDTQIAPAYALRVGAHGWYLRDRAGGAGGFLGTGPTSALSELQGGPRLDYRLFEGDAAPRVDADLLWLAVDVGWNTRLDAGRVGATGLLVANFGELAIEGQPSVGTQGYLADAELRARIGPGDGSIVHVEGVWASSDGTGADYYTGMLTGNAYGAVGAVYASHGTYLLFPDPGAINRQVSVVYDVSNGGRGVAAVSAGLAWDVVPSRVNVAVGAAHARTGDFSPLGTELNARVSAEPWLLGNVALTGATVLGTDLPVAPWTAFLSLDWLVL